MNIFVVVDISGIHTEYSTTTVNEQMEDDTSSPASLLNKFHFDYEETSVKRLGKDVVQNVVNHVLWTKGGEFDGSSVECSPILPEPEIQQIDQRINHWQTYLRQHARISEKLSKATGKTKSALLINKNEDFRKKQQCKKLFDIAERLSPNKLMNRPLGRLKDIPPAPTIFETLPKTERKARPFLTFTEMPKVALEEQGQSSRLQKSNWLQSEYLDKKCIQSKDKLTRVVAHYPNMKKLQIVGTKMKSLVANLDEKKSDIQIPDNIEFRITQKWYRDKESSLQHVISINDKHFDADFKYKQNVNFPYFFEAKPHEYEIRSLTIRNRGSKSVDIGWVRIDPCRPELLTRLQLKNQIIPSFYFNKNTLSIQPGSVDNLEITFCCRESGIYEENWEMITVPSFLEQNYIFTISLFGHCRTSDCDRQKIFEIEKSINERSARRVADNIAYDLPTYAILDPIGSMADIMPQSELFTLVNPNLIYNEDCVEQLEDMFVEIVGNNHKKASMKWNFDLKELKNHILNIVHEDERNEFYNRFETIVGEMKTCAVMVRPNYEDQKFLLVKNVLLELADSMEQIVETLCEAIMHTQYDLSFDEVLVTDNQLIGNRADNDNAQSKINVNNKYICVVKSAHVRNAKKEAFHESLCIQTNGLLCNAVDEIVGILEGMKNVE